MSRVLSFERYFNERDKGRGLKTGMRAVLCSAFSVCIMAAFGCGLSFGATGEGPAEAYDAGASQRRDILVTEDNVDRFASDALSGYSEPLSYEAVMNTEWVFPAGSTEAKVYIENSIENKTPVILRVFADGDDQQPVFESEVIAPGEKLRRVKLKSVLAPGRHGARARYFLVDSAGNELGSVSVGMTIVIEE